MPELTVKVLDDQGLRLALTIPGESVSALLKAWPDMRGHLIKAGYKPQGASRPGPEASEIEQADDATVTKTISAEVMVFAGKKKQGDEVFWRVKGGPYMTHGVPIYKEALKAALEAGVFFTDGPLNPAEDYDLTGITAHIEMKDSDEKGPQPYKVFRLTRPDR